MEVVDRGRIGAAAREEALRAIHHWGRTSVHICLDDAQYAALLAAGIRDPRSGHEIQQQTNTERRA
jgi:hypothetical protein